MPGRQMAHGTPPPYSPLLAIIYDHNIYPGRRNETHSVFTESAHRQFCLPINSALKKAVLRAEGVGGGARSPQMGVRKTR